MHAYPVLEDSEAILNASTMMYFYNHDNHCGHYLSVFLFKHNVQKETDPVSETPRILKIL